MPYSDTRFDPQIIFEFHKMFHFTKPNVLDVGPGAGKVSKLLRSWCCRMVAIEIFEPYVEQFDLKNKYDEVRVMNVMNISADMAWSFQLITACDVLEHLSIEDATRLISFFRVGKCRMIVQVPFLYEQGTECGNIYETHLQPDLTRAVMAERYPLLKEVKADERLGLYIL